MNIDWSKAPEDFPLWLEGLGEHAKHSGWYRRAGDVFEHETHGQFRAFREGQFFTVHHQPEQLAWTGEGLPPVGTVCEFAGFNPEETLPTDPRVGDQVTVIAHFMSGSFEVAAFTFYAPPEFRYLKVSQGAYGCFRPIRTPEQIAEEARVAELNLMVGAIKDYPGGRHGVDHLTQLRIHEEVCIDLYDAGWRKQVTT
ncbi:hypothetical protein [Pseudomonas sp. E102]|uniref:hypothetical protein n=1 Tax=Pseudomonas sp. E102 TaxID=181579 RepID=UPI004045CFCE